MRFLNTKKKGFHLSTPEINDFFLLPKDFWGNLVGGGVTLSCHIGIRNRLVGNDVRVKLRCNLPSFRIIIQVKTLHFGETAGEEGI